MFSNVDWMSRFGKTSHNLKSPYVFSSLRGVKKKLNPSVVTLLSSV